MLLALDGERLTTLLLLIRLDGSDSDDVELLLRSPSSPRLRSVDQLTGGERDGGWIRLAEGDRDLLSAGDGGTVGDLDDGTRSSWLLPESPELDKLFFRRMGCCCCWMGSLLALPPDFIGLSGCLGCAARSEEEDEAEEQLDDREELTALMAGDGILLMELLRETDAAGVAVLLAAAGLVLDWRLPLSGDVNEFRREPGADGLADPLDFLAWRLDLR